MLTFDGNVRLKEKATYERIRQHLESVYKRHFGYGTVVELCIARNKRRKSSKRYHGVAKVTSRRARKGFNLRYNPDAHWSSAFYKQLNRLQYSDGKTIVNINRDDAAGFRLDTLTTNKQYTTPTVSGSQVLTTRTDFVNKHPLFLQTTSYNFTATATTKEFCVGVVKAPKIHQKNPAQHTADLKINENSIWYLMFPLGFLRQLTVRVDRATDEGPSIDEVQYWWTERHILKTKAASIITTRSSGSSFLNRVELQNGCLSLGHTNTFIPSTLGGSCINPETGSIDESKLKENLSLAVDAYISRTDGCPCGDTEIKLYKGVHSPYHYEKLQVFFKGSKQAKAELKRKDPELFPQFEKVWNIRNRHMVPNLPHYIFFWYVVIRMVASTHCAKLANQKLHLHGTLGDLHLPTCHCRSRIHLDHGVVNRA